jgi:hypothetical protein
MYSTQKISGYKIHSRLFASSNLPKTSRESGLTTSRLACHHEKPRRFWLGQPGIYRVKDPLSARKLAKAVPKVSRKVEGRFIIARCHRTPYVCRHLNRDTQNRLVPAKPRTEEASTSDTLDFGSRHVFGFIDLLFDPGLA